MYLVRNLTDYSYPAIARSSATVTTQRSFTLWTRSPVRCNSADRSTSRSRAYSTVGPARELSSGTARKLWIPSRHWDRVIVIPRLVVLRKNNPKTKCGATPPWDDFHGIHQDSVGVVHNPQPYYLY